MLLRLHSYPLPLWDYVIEIFIALVGSSIFGSHMLSTPNHIWLKGYTPMSKYLKPGMRLCILFVLVITASLLSRPPKVLANDCTNQCLLELHMCTPACNGDAA